ATLKRRRSFSLSTSSVNSFALVNIWKNSWVVLAGSSFAMGASSRERKGCRILSQLLALQRQHLLLQESVLQGDPGLVDEDLERLQARPRAAALRVVPEQERDRLPVGEQRQQGDRPRLEPPHLAHQVLHRLVLGRRAAEGLAGGRNVPEGRALLQRDHDAAGQEVQALLLWGRAATL